MDIKELYWAAGFIEGEGCFSCVLDTRGRRFYSARVTVSQKNIEPLERLTKVFPGGNMTRHRQSGVMNWQLYGNKAIGVMMTVWSLMSSKRQREIERAIELWKENVPRNEWLIKRGCNGKFVGGAPATRRPAAS